MLPFFFCPFWRCVSAFWLQKYSDMLPIDLLSEHTFSPFWEPGECIGCEIYCIYKFGEYILGTSPNVFSFHESDPITSGELIIFIGKAQNLCFPSNILELLRKRKISNSDTLIEKQDSDLDPLIPDSNDEIKDNNDEENSPSLINVDNDNNSVPSINPYCMLEMNNETKKTKQKFSSADPNWGETFTKKKNWKIFKNPIFFCLIRFCVLTIFFNFFFVFFQYWTFMKIKCN